MFKYCVICKKKIVKPLNESVKSFTFRRKTCSRKCQNKWQESRIAWNKGLHPEYMQGNNHPMFGTHPIAWNKGKKGAQVAWNRGKNNPYWSGENNPNWKGGITKENEKIRRTIEYKNWRRAVFERDNFTCQICGKIGGELEADHIKPQSLFPELRFDISNGRALCIPCHRKTDTYGNNIKRYSTALTPK